MIKIQDCVRGHLNWGVMGPQKKRSDHLSNLTVPISNNVHALLLVKRVIPFAQENSDRYTLYPECVPQTIDQIAHIAIW